MSIAFLHSLLRNLILYFGPILLISALLILSIGNVSLYKQSLNQNNFYSQIASEFDKTKPESAIQKEVSLQDNFYNQIIWNNIDNKLNSPDWLKNVSEINIDRANLWIVGTSDSFEPYLPLNEDKNIDTTKPNWWTNITTESSKALDQLQNQAKKLNIPNIELPINIEQPKIPPDLNNLNPLNQVNQFWINIWNGLRSYYWQLQNLAWSALVIYSIALLGVIASSILFGKNPITELGIISRKLGFNIIISSVFFIISTSAAFLVGSVIKGFIPNSFLIGNIAGIINWQIIWLIVSVMTPALIIGGVLAIVGLVLSLQTPRLSNSR